ncbi:adenosylcobinamide-phosphate synthase CbiB [Wenxinia marina]|uniref:Cobalamin biosynthesis protein CobD n=1 Tax=Wenxinia marina DSM 24838 TaxID=1123501 RepID=A0A0D0QAS8_9RHOB|nr:adenosylcobinamide-phosphate synthase CbiB [Wenxinia marina]KIQ68058.1 cobalamin biosynthesis protein CobD [Wenxinia marina DSM 24838]GGL75059.1 cobalamin biosynthesis protein CobD [Wenxinia marina]
MTLLAAALAGLALDAAFGEPRALWDRAPHPAVLMGRAVARLDAAWNRVRHRLARGAAAYAVLAGGAILLGLALAALPGSVAEALVLAILLAQRSLADHVRAVADALRLSVPEGRRAVARIVGRDTAAMDEPAVSRAAVESAAENFSDGVVAPLFWFLVGGLPGLLLYKVTNTADSMIGYRTERYERFGKVAARADDVLNIVPARLTAAMVWLCRPDRAVLPGLVADARRHRSPNAGWPEAALSRLLGLALSGPRAYHGTMRDYPYVNEGGRREAGPADIDRAVRVLWTVWAGIVGAVGVAALVAAAV